VLLACLVTADRAAGAPLTVVELFTSQGCSACPPADALLGEIARQPDILALSEHVDYWDYLGWHDPYAMASMTVRQRAYARSLGLKYVYTPQVVVQGLLQAAGTDRAAVLKAIAEAPATTVDLDLAWNGPGRLAVRLGKAPPEARPSDIWFVLFDRTRTTRIGTGENSGRQLVNHHVVREFRHVAAWDGQPGEVVVAVPAMDPQAAGCAVIVQAMDGGPVHGAARCAAPPG
jgi:hypothetical protein